MSTDSPSDLSPEEVTALRDEHDLTFCDLPAEASVEAEREVDRLLLAYAGVEAQIAANVEAFKAEVQRAEQWRDRVNRNPLRQQAWLRGQMEALAPFVRRFGKAKSRDLPHGTVGWRTNPERLTIDDPAAAVAYAHTVDLPTETKTEETVRHAVLVEFWKEKRARDKSFVPPGCRVIPAEEVFQVQIPKGGVG